MMNRLTASLIGLISVLPATAFAGGYTLPLQSARAIGVGGALVAGAERGDAFWYNPSLLGGTGLDISVSMVALDATFTRSGGEQDGASVSNEAAPLPIPSIGFVWEADEHVSFGLGAYAPFGAQYQFAEDGPQRYSLVENNQTKLLFIHAAAAVRFGGFSFGGGVQNVIASVQQRVAFSGYTGLFGFSEDPELDVLTELEMHDPFTITANFGASYDFGPIRIGAALQLPYTIGGEGEFRVRLPSSVFFDSAEVEGNKVYTEIPFPLAVRGGILWRINPRWSLEGAVNFEGWSIQDEIRITPVGDITLTNVPGIGNYQLGEVVLPRNMKDTVSFHLGADGRLLDWLHARAGLFYETSAFDDETFSVAVIDGNKIGASLGASFDVGPVRLDVAASRVFQSTREITNSQMTQLNPTNPDQTEVVGNGTYESGFWTAGIGAAWAFDFGASEDTGFAAGAKTEETTVARVE